MGDRPVVGALFAVSFVVFLWAPVRQYADSHYALLLSESLYRHHQADLSRFLPPPPLDPERFPGILVDLDGPRWWIEGYPYQLERAADGTLHYRYGPGTSFLSIPFVAVFNALGVSAVGEDGLYDVRADQRMQTVLAALVSAGLVVALHGLARLLLPSSWALPAAAGAAFASPVLSTASRALWSHSWGTLLLTAALAVVLRSEREDGRAPGALLAALLSAVVLVRPANAVHAVVLGAYVLLRRPRSSGRFVATAALGAALGLLWSWQTRGAAVPDYYRGRRLTVATLPEALIGHLLSPSRGFLVFCPVVVVLAWLVWRYARSPGSRRLVALSLVAMVLHVLLASTVRRWWGGHSFGPRLLTELVPWWLLLAILALRGIRDATARAGRAPPGWRVERALLALLLSWGLFVHWRGATALPTWTWNVLPRPIDESPERVWSWSEPQFLAGLSPAARAGPDRR